MLRGSQRQTDHQELLGRKWRTNNNKCCCASRRPRGAPASTLGAASDLPSPNGHGSTRKGGDRKGGDRKGGGSSALWELPYRVGLNRVGLSYWEEPERERGPEQRGEGGTAAAAPGSTDLRRCWRKLRGTELKHPKEARPEARLCFGSLPWAPAPRWHTARMQGAVDPPCFIHVCLVASG